MPRRRRRRPSPRRHRRPASASATASASPVAADRRDWISHRRPQRAARWPHGHAPARRQGARRERHDARHRCGHRRALRPGHRDVDSHRQAWSRPAPGTRPRSFPTAGSWWPAASPIGSAHRQPSCTTRPAGRGRRPEPWPSSARATEPRCCPMAPCSSSAATASRAATAPFPLASAELFDPASGTWTAAASMAGGRIGPDHDAAGRWHRARGGRLRRPRRPSSRRLPSCTTPTPGPGRRRATDRALGFTRPRCWPMAPCSSRRAPESGAAHWRPPSSTIPATGSWTATGDMIDARSGSATLLSDGTVLVAGGRRRHGHSTAYAASAELYDPATGAGPRPRA